jgi:hypothetical protein
MEMTLREYAAPLRGTQVDQITTDDVLAVLKPLWQTRPETASRVRARIERVLEAARAQGCVRATTLPDGAATWINCSLSDSGSMTLIMARCPMPKFRNF